MSERMSHAEYVHLQRVRALDAARAIISGQRSVIDGCRFLTALRFELELPDVSKDFDPIVGIDSDSDHLPVGESRQYWAADALERKDIEIAEFESSYREYAIQACAVLIAKLEKTVQQAVHGNTH